MPLREPQFKIHARLFLCLCLQQNFLTLFMMSGASAEKIPCFLGVWSRNCFANNLSYCGEVRVNSPFTTVVVLLIPNVGRYGMSVQHRAVFFVKQEIL